MRAASSRLRAIGALLLAIGGVFTVIGLGSFFSSFGSFSSPQYFWCVFVGLPLVGIGTACLKAGYLGTIARYVANETAPVAADTVDYLAEETKGAVRTVAGAVAAGVRGETALARTCHACHAEQRADAKFCDRCGAVLAANACAGCRTALEPQASFCHACGKAVAG